MSQIERCSECQSGNYELTFDPNCGDKVCHFCLQDRILMADGYGEIEKYSFVNDAIITDMLKKSIEQQTKNA